MRPLFGTDGVRGTANAFPITPEIALQVGKATAHVLHARGHGSTRAIIGKDTRLSGYMLETALTSGLVSMGMDVYLVGPMPTPAVAHLTRSMGAAVGIMITASHNPAADNGIKIFNGAGLKLSDALETRIEELVLGERITSRHIPFDQIGKAYRIDDARGRYIEFAKSTAGNLDLSGMKIALDCAHGAAYFIGPLILRELGAEVVKVAAAPDGFNINRDCGVTHPATLGAAVRREHADVGIALDGDADRVVMCGPDGQTLDGDRLLGLLAVELKRHGRLKDDRLVVTVMSNLGLHRAMEKHGIRIATTPVGDRCVIDEMRRTGASLGGEQSGHIILSDHATTGDGIISALQVLRVAREHGRTLPELTAFIPLYPRQLTNVRVRERRRLDEMPLLTRVRDECEADLGADGRCLIRYSGTENLVRILVEAVEAARVDSWSRRLATALEQELG